MTNIVNVTNENFEEEVINSNLPVIVDFWASWCGPCKMLSPMLDNIENQNSGSVKIAKVDVDKNQELAMKYDVQSIPTVFFFNKGQIVGNALIGVQPIDKYQEILDSLKGDNKHEQTGTTDTKNKYDIVGKESFEKNLGKEGLVIVDFWASWCGPCKVLGPVLDKICEEYGNKVTLLKVNVDEQQNQDLASLYGVTGIPQVNFFKGGNMVDGFVGAIMYDQVKQYVDKNI